MEKWKKSVVHLECATDREHFYDKIKRIKSLWKQHDEGKIIEEQFLEEMTKGTREIRYHGTAIFLAHKQRRYLITARHVLFDKISAERESQEELFRTNNLPEEIKKLNLQFYNNTIFNIIFGVPSFDEVIRRDRKTVNEFLMNLGAGTTNTVPYTFSEPNLDIAIISLDQRNSRFADKLINLGYEPVTMDDIADEPSKEGAEVFTVGFQEATAILGQFNQHPATAHWSSSYFSLPAYAFGRVSMLHKELAFFWGDMSIYPGNSGGPVVESDKLVGIVTGQPTIPLDHMEQVRTRIPFGKIIKAKHIVELILAQEKKDAFFHGLFDTPKSDLHG